MWVQTPQAPTRGDLRMGSSSILDPAFGPSAGSREGLDGGCPLGHPPGLRSLGPTVPSAHSWGRRAGSQQALGLGAPLPARCRRHHKPDITARGLSNLQNRQKKPGSPAKNTWLAGRSCQSFSWTLTRDSRAKIVGLVNHWHLTPTPTKGMGGQEETGCFVKGLPVLEDTSFFPHPESTLARGSPWLAHDFSCRAQRLLQWDFTYEIEQSY